MACHHRGAPASPWDVGQWGDVDARVPAGNYVVDVQYWPTLFSEGIHTGLITAIASFSAWFSRCLWTRRARSPRRRKNPREADASDVENSDGLEVHQQVHR